MVAKDPHEPSTQAFRPVSPATLRDPELGPLLVRLRDHDPDVFDAVADVDRSLIWAALKEPPKVRAARAVGLAQLAESARRAR
jgi:hypothetical protein